MKYMYVLKPPTFLNADITGKECTEKLTETLNYYKYFFIFLGIVTITILRIYKISTYTSNFVKRYCISINIDVLDQLTFAWYAHINICYCKDISIPSLAYSLKYINIPFKMCLVIMNNEQSNYRLTT